jgi:hypothetical protein
LRAETISGRTREPSRPTAVVPPSSRARGAMNNVIYIVGLVVVVLAILAFLGLR